MMNIFGAGALAVALATPAGALPITTIAPPAAAAIPVFDGCGPYGHRGPYLNRGPILGSSGGLY